MLMSIGDLQALLTLIAFVAFIGIVIWAYSSRRSRDFSEAAAIPLDDDLPLMAAGRRVESKEAK
jgi:cytochrome c oxidase cbb3-type subunit IV